MSTVTVVIPSILTRSVYLAKALASVAAQERPPEAVIIVYDQNHTGAAATRNRALPMVKTDYIAFLDDDDTFLPNHLRLLMETAEQTGADLVYPWFEGGEDLHLWNNGARMSPFGVPFSPELKNYMLYEQNFIPITFLVNTRFANIVGGFPQPNTPAWPWVDAEDYGFLRRLLAADATFVHLPVVTWKWRMHDGRTRGQVR